MFNTDLFQASRKSEKATRLAEYAAMVELVLGEVHPAQFTELPPSPREIEVKATMLGVRVYP
jgi:hypothetical protein